MNLTVELHEVVERLDDSGKMLLLQVAKRFLPEDDDWDEVFPNDLYYIDLAEKELENGEAPNWSDVQWKIK